MWGSTSGEGTCRWTFTLVMSTIGRRRIIMARTDGIGGLRLLQGDGTATMGLLLSTPINTAARTIARIIGAVSVGNRSVLVMWKGLSQKRGLSPLEVVALRRKVPQSPLSAEIAVALGKSMSVFLIVASAWLFS